MNDIRKILLTEWHQCRRRKIIVLLPMLVTLISALMFLAVSFAARENWIGLPSGFYIIAETMNWLLSIFGLLAVVLTSFTISGEFALGTVKAAWVRPLSRRNWYLGKLLAVAIAVSILFLLSILVVTGFSWAQFDLTDLMEKDTLIHSCGNLVTYLVIVVGLSLWAIWSLIAVVGFISTLCQRPGGAITITIAFFLLLTALGIFTEVKQALLSFCFTTPFEQMTIMSKGLFPDWTGLIQSNIAVCALWLLAALAGGLVVIKRKEITF